LPTLVGIVRKQCAERKRTGIKKTILTITTRMALNLELKTGIEFDGVAALV
jgi:hypothetical protein